MCSLNRDNDLLTIIPSHNRGILNVFSGEKATLEQETDMLTFHQISTQLI